MATPPVFSAGAVLTAAQMNAVGMWEITPSSVAGSGVSLSGATVTLSGATAANINGCFSSDYDNYRIVFSEFLSNGTNGVYLRLRTSSDAATTYYYGGLYRLFAGGGGDITAVAAGTNWLTITCNTTVRSAGTYDIYGPNLTQFTQFQGMGSNFDAQVLTAGVHQTASAYTGFSVLSLSGNTLSGKVRIYGYRN